MKKYLRPLAVLFAALTGLFSTFGFGQTPTASATDGSTPSALAKGSHPLGTYGGSNFDRVNLFNGNVSFSFPLAGFSGRAGNTTVLTLGYNSKIWKTETITVQQGDQRTIADYGDWDPEASQVAPGWNLITGRMVGRQTGWETASCKDGNNRPAQKWAKTLTRFTFTAPDGTEYDFRDDLTNGQPFQDQGCDNGLSRGTFFHSVDGTSATFLNTDENYQPKEVRDVIAFAVEGARPLYPFGFVALRDGTRFKIAEGRIVEQRDRNGNVIAYQYDGNGRILKITDTLGRVIALDYKNGNPYFFKVTYPGTDGVNRDITVGGAKLKGALQAGDVATLPQLFPELDLVQPLKFDPRVVRSITLPSGHTWLFTYNQYGEVVEVKTPSEGVIKYRMPDTSGVAELGTSRQIFRRVLERQVWVSASEFEGKTTYSDPTLKGGDGNPLPVLEKHIGSLLGDTPLLAATSHQFVGTPFDNYGKQYGVPPKTGYKPWLEGKEIRTAELDAGLGELRVTSYDWEQRAPVAWVTSDRNALAQPENDPRLVRTRVTWKDTSQTSITESDYDEFNNVVEERVFDYNPATPDGSRAGGTLLRRMTREYLSTNPDAQPVRDYQRNFEIHMKSLVKIERVFGPNGVQESETRYEYDKYDGAPLLARAFAPAANATRDQNYNLTAPGGGTLQYRPWRGNVTRMESGQPGNLSQSTFSRMKYDVAGNVVETTSPPSGAGSLVTVINYQSLNPQTNAEYFGYPVVSSRTVTEADGRRTTLTSSQTFDFFTGLVKSAQGFNPGEVTTYTYNDLLDRVTLEQRPGNLGSTRYEYSPPGQLPWVRTRTTVTTGTGPQDMVAESFFDGMLKVKESVRNDAPLPGQNTPRQVRSLTKYDGLGRAALASNPYRTGSESTYGWTRTGYDTLSRVTTVETASDEAMTMSRTGTVMSEYRGNSVTVTDQEGKQRKSVTDALGRIRQVLEPNLQTRSLTQSTEYSYDGRGNLLQVNQSGQTRQFEYDALSRLRRAVAPESGQMLYEYDQASNLTRRTDGRSVVTQYSYDEMNRVLTKSYSDGTPRVRYFYDDSTLPRTPQGFARGASLGRLVEVYTDPTARQAETVTATGYETGGLAVSGGQRLDGQDYPTAMSYAQPGLPIGMTYPSGAQVTTAYNLAAQAVTVKRNGTTLASDVTYSGYFPTKVPKLS